MEKEAKPVVGPKEIGYVINKGVGNLGTVSFGNYALPEGSDEAERCAAIKTMLREYWEHPVKDEDAKPLSIAVFGPPGSGKSRCVKGIAADLNDIPPKNADGKTGGGTKNEKPELKFAKLIVINLSQLSNPETLVTEIKKVFPPKKDVAVPPVLPPKEKKAVKPPIPIVFFDEFDSSLNGVALGWLRWFLALMQDGEIEAGGKPIGKAVFMFAGGTAETLKEFEERARLNEVSFREKKVPDFISRLRGFIDIQGINCRDKYQVVRRALALRHQLDQRWPGKRERVKKFPIGKDQVKSLLSTVYFLHGSRSMDALLSMSTLKGKIIHFPDLQLGKLHASRGKLDGKLIGISAGLEQSFPLLNDISSALLEEGTVLAYGGDFHSKGTLGSIAEAAKKLPKDLFGRKDKRILNYLGFPSFHRPKFDEDRKYADEFIKTEKLETLSQREKTDLNLAEHDWFPARPLKEYPEFPKYQPNHHLAWQISLFRMRMRLIRDVHALIVFGGKDEEESWGRFSGVAEEVMLAIAFGKPVYVLGGRHGAAEAIGKLLGLGSVIANPDECLNEVKSLAPIRPPEFKRAFEIPNLQLPETVGELRDYLFAHSLDSKEWPWNGLTSEENRELFCTEIKDGDNVGGKVCVELILKGLSRLDWKRPSARQRR